MVDKFSLITADTVRELCEEKYWTIEEVIKIVAGAQQIKTLRSVTALIAPQIRSVDNSAVRLGYELVVGELNEVISQLAGVVHE